MLEDLRGGDPAALAQAVRGLVVAANQDPQLRAVFTTFSDTNPSIYLNIDRDKAQVLGVQLNDVLHALKASLGGFYVNDMNFTRMTMSWRMRGQKPAWDLRPTMNRDSC